MSSMEEYRLLIFVNITRLRIKHGRHTVRSNSYGHFFSKNDVVKYKHTWAQHLWINIQSARLNIIVYAEDILLTYKRFHCSDVYLYEYNCTNSNLYQTVVCPWASILETITCMAASLDILFIAMNFFFINYNFPHRLLGSVFSKMF